MFGTFHVDYFSLAESTVKFVGYNSPRPSNRLIVPPRLSEADKAWPSRQGLRQAPYPPDLGFFDRQFRQLSLQTLAQFLRAGYTQQVELNQLHHPFGRPPAGVKLQEYRRDQR